MPCPPPDLTPCEALAGDGDTMEAKEAAALLGVRIGTVYNLMRTGRLAHYRIGRRRLPDKGGVIAFKRASYVPARTPDQPGNPTPYKFKHLFQNKRR